MMQTIKPKSKRSNLKRFLRREPPVGVRRQERDGRMDLRGRTERGLSLSMGDGAGDPLTKGRRVMARKSGRASVKPGGTAGRLKIILSQQSLI